MIVVGTAGSSSPGSKARLRGNSTSRMARAAASGERILPPERDVPGGQASHTSLIENFFGFPEGIGGAELARRAVPRSGRQARCRF